MKAERQADKTYYTSSPTLVGWLGPSQGGWGPGQGVVGLVKGLEKRGLGAWPGWSKTRGLGAWPGWSETRGLGARVAGKVVMTM